jgi:hypothetical protein
VRAWYIQTWSKAPNRCRKTKSYNSHARMHVQRTSARALVQRSNAPASLAPETQIKRAPFSLATAVGFCSINREPPQMLRAPLHTPYCRQAASLLIYAARLPHSSSKTTARLPLCRITRSQERSSSWTPSLHQLECRRRWAAHYGARLIPSPSSSSRLHGARKQLHQHHDQGLMRSFTLLS